MSIALAHKRRVLALGPAAVATVEPYSSSTALASPANAQKQLKLMEGALAIDLERLSALNMANRQQLKRDELLPKYMDYVERYRDSGLNHPNPVLVQVMVWLFDTEQFELALQVAMFAIEQGQSMPERFKRRDVQTFVGDALIEWAENEQKCKRSPEPYLSDMLPFVDGEWELTEQIPAKYHKLIGIRAMDAKDWETAIRHFERATELHPGIGVDTRLKGARKALEKQRATPASE